MPTIQLHSLSFAKNSRTNEIQAVFQQTILRLRTVDRAPQRPQLQWADFLMNLILLDQSPNERITKLRSFPEKFHFCFPEKSGWIPVIGPVFPAEVLRNGQFLCHLAEWPPRRGLNRKTQRFCWAAFQWTSGSLRVIGTGRCGRCTWALFGDTRTLLHHRLRHTESL